MVSASFFWLSFSRSAADRMVRRLFFLRRCSKIVTGRPYRASNRGGVLDTPVADLGDVNQPLDSWSNSTKAPKSRILVTRQKVLLNSRLPDAATNGSSIVCFSRGPPWFSFLFLDFEHFDLNRLADLDHLSRIIHTGMRQFGDVEQSLKASRSTKAPKGCSFASASTVPPR